MREGEDEPALGRQVQSTKTGSHRSSHCGAVETDLTSILEDAGSIPGLRIWRCQELWCRSKMQLASHVAVAVAVASSCSSDLTPSLRNFIYCRCSPKKQNKKKKKGSNFNPLLPFLHGVGESSIPKAEGSGHWWVWAPAPPDSEPLRVHPFHMADMEL